MFSNIGATEIIIVLGIVVLLFGGKKIPEMIRGAGEAVKEFKAGAEDEKKPTKKSDHES